MTPLRTIRPGRHPAPESRHEGLVIALDDTASLDDRAAAALVEAATESAAEAFFGDIEIDGRPTRRSAWSPTRLLTEPTAASPLAVRSTWLERHGIEADDPALPLRLVETRARVAHIPVVLSRHDRPPVPPSLEEMRAHLEHRGLPATIDAVGSPPVPRPGWRPSLDVVIPSAGRSVDGDRPAIETLLDHLTPAPDGGILVVVGDEYEGDPAELERRDGVRVLHRPPGPFNFSAAVNQGILAAQRDLVLLLNDDTEPLVDVALRSMAMHLADPGVAAVGALLTYPDHTIQHVGMVIDDARPLHSFVGQRPGDAAVHGAAIAREVVAVTGACLMARRRDLLAVGGLSTSFPLSFNDVDLCVRLQRHIGRVVVEPGARFVHHETLSREPTISAAEWDHWIHRWGEIVDPWYHPAFHRPDDPHRLHRNADHLPPLDDLVPSAGLLREPVLHSRVHRGRAAATVG